MMPTTSPDARFDLRVQTLLSPGTFCVALAFQPPSGSRWQDTTVKLPAVNLESDYPHASSAVVTTNVLLSGKADF
jgi:hypothetical protein